MKWKETRLQLSLLRCIEDITCSRVDMNLIFECSSRYLTNERSERVRYWVEHGKIKFISTTGHLIFCLLYKHQWKRRNLLCNSHGDLFTCEDNMLFWHVNWIWSFRVKAHLVFHCPVVTWWNSAISLSEEVPFVYQKKSRTSAMHPGRKFPRTDTVVNYILYSSPLNFLRFSLV